MIQLDSRAAAAVEGEFTVSCRTAGSANNAQAGTAHRGLLVSASGFAAHLFGPAEGLAALAKDVVKVDSADTRAE